MTTTSPSIFSTTIYLNGAIVSHHFHIANDILYIIYRKKKVPSKGVTIVAEETAKSRRKLLGKSFPTSEVAELRRLADEYKVK